MFGRPFSFRFVVALFALSIFSLSPGLPAFSQDRPADPAEAVIKSADEGEKENELVQEIFPYASKAYTIDFPSNDVISSTTYAFNSLTGIALEDMSSGTTQLVGASADDTASAVTNLGFDFWYDGVRQNQFSVNANGLVRLGSTVIGTTFNNSTSGLDTVTNAPKIAPYFEDLCTGPNGKVHYKVVGSAPNRKLVIEWVNM